MDHEAFHCESCSVKTGEQRYRRCKKGRLPGKYGTIFLVALMATLPQGGHCGIENRNHRNDLALPWLRDAMVGSLPQRFGAWLKASTPFRRRASPGRVTAMRTSPQSPIPLDNPPLGTLKEDERDDQEVANEQLCHDGGSNLLDIDPNPAIIPALGGAIQSLLSDPQRMKHWAGKSLQIFLLWKLTEGIFKAITEALEEFSMEGLSGGDPYFCSRTDLQRVLLSLDLSSNPETVPRAPYELAKDLRAAGLPLRASPNEQRTSIESLFHDLTKAEASILHQCLWRPPPAARLQPGEMWDSVIGLEEVKERLLLTVASSSPNIKLSDRSQGLVRETQEAYSSLLTGTETSSTSHHHGVLLFGEPGCGKSFLVQALAAKLQWPCLVVSPSVLMRKYVGETNLQVRALFSLIQKKLSPCIVILDELDGLFRERHDSENDASREVKTEVLQWMSGIMAPSNSPDRHPPIIVGATNRPSDVDSAILRRLPQRFYIGPPAFPTRCQLLRKLLQEVPLAGDFSFDYVSQRMEGYTPSDIQQVLRTAARVGPLKEAIIFEQQQQNGSANVPRGAVRPLTTQDVMVALAHVHATPLSHRYRQDLQKFANLNDGNDWNEGNGAQGQLQHNPMGLHFADFGTVQVPYPDTTSAGNYDQQQQLDSDYDESEDDSDNDADLDISDFEL